MFFLVSGGAASGKSTLVRHLSSRVEDLICHDSDEKLATDQNMRCQQLEEWIQLALNHQQEGQDFLLAAHSPLGELLACPSARKLVGISACLLDCSDTLRIQRMRARGIDPQWPPSQSTLNWAAWHRMHAWDPQWEQSVILGNGSSEHDYTCWTGWQQSDPKWKIKVIDTTPLRIEQVLSAIAEWVEIERNKVSALTSASKWWKQ